MSPRLRTTDLDHYENRKNDKFSIDTSNMYVICDRRSF